MRTTRQDVVDLLARERVDLDEFDQEDAAEIVDVLLEAYSPLEVMTWLCMPDRDLDSTPLMMVREGRTRAVMVAARRMVARRSP